MDTLMLMSVKVINMADVPKSLVIPSSNLKLNETVGQGNVQCIQQSMYLCEEV